MFNNDELLVKLYSAVKMGAVREWSDNVPYPMDFVHVLTREMDSAGNVCFVYYYSPNKNLFYCVVSF